MDDVEPPVEATTSLPHVLSRLREQHLSLPSSSPLDLVRQFRHIPFSDDDQQPPPTPPPPIVLDPQPHSSNPRKLLTPFLLQALFLGASALGLLARRKVRAPAEVAVEKEKRAGDKAVRAAEDRVDEIQALDLLVGAFAAPEVAESIEVEASAEMLEKRSEVLCSLAKEVEARKLPVGRTAVAGVLHHLSQVPPSPPSVFAAEMGTAPHLFAWSWAAYEALPPVSSSPSPTSSSTTDLSLDDALLSAFLSLAYRADSNAPLSRQRAFAHYVDRQILSSVSRRLLSRADPPPPTLLSDLARAAVRACRLDILTKLLAHDSLDSKLRLFLARAALTVLARDGGGRAKDPEQVVPLVGAFVKAVRGLDEVGPDELKCIEGGLRRLYSNFSSAGVAFERYLAFVVFSVLDRAPEVVSGHPTFVVHALEHLSRSRNPRLARRILDAIPYPLRRLEHYEPVLSSFHSISSRVAWDSLLRDTDLTPQLSTFIAYLRSQAHHNASLPATTLPTTQHLVRMMHHCGIPKTREVYDLVLRVLTRHGSDAALRRTLSRMEERDGFPRDGSEKTLAILAQREMVRRDVQVRRVVEVGEDGRREVRVVERARRGGGRAQMRKVATAVEAGEEQLRLSRETAEGKKARKAQVEEDPERPSMLANVLLKNVSRWTKEVGVEHLIALARAQLGVEFSFPPPSASSPPPTSPAAPQRKLRAAPSAPLPIAHLTWSHFKTVREPAFRTLAKSFRTRGGEYGQQAARALEELLTMEKGMVGRAEKARQRKEKGREGERERKMGRARARDEVAEPKR
ncbi:hypothetical protein JCM8097_007431 [Rhodosporidiobolus ruineniae]